MAVFKPEQNNDDCYLLGGGMYLAYHPWYMGNVSGYVADGGVRFSNVTIPKNATILTAKVTVQSYGDYSYNVCNIKINGEAADNAATFSTAANYNGRTRTTEYVDWNDIPDWAGNTDYDSPSLIAIIQEIVNRTGWASGNHLALFFKNNSSDTMAYRAAKAYSGSTTLCARLTVTWTEPGGGGAFFQLFE